MSEKDKETATTQARAATDRQLQQVAELLVDREGFEIGENETVGAAAIRVIGELDNKIDELEGALAKCENSIRGFKSAATKAKRGMTALERSDEPRTVGPIEDSDPELIAMAMEGEVQVVASDGEHELVEFTPFGIVGVESWRPQGAKRMLIPGLTLAPGEVPAAIEVKGFGLFTEDEQIAWCEFAAPIVVAPMTQVRVENAIAF